MFVPHRRMGYLTPLCGGDGEPSTVLSVILPPAGGRWKGKILAWLKRPSTRPPCSFGFFRREFPATD